MLTDDTTEIPVLKNEYDRRFGRATGAAGWSAQKNLVIGTLVSFVVLGLLGGYALDTLKAWKPPGQVVDQMTATGLGVDTVTDDASGLYGSFDEFAFREPLTFDSSERTFLESLTHPPYRPGSYGDTPEESSTNKRFLEMVQDRHGIKIGAMDTLVKLQNTTSQNMSIRDIRARFLEKGPVWTGGVFCHDKQGGGAVDQVNLDLDEDRPVPMLADEAGTSVAPLLSRRQYTFTSNELVTINVHFELLRSYASFVLDVDYDSPSGRGTVVVDDHGKPFELTGPARPESFRSDPVTYRKGLTGYQTGWVLPPDGAAREVRIGAGDGC